MTRLYLCVTTQHDFRMLALAVFVCLAGCYATSAIGVFAVLTRDRAARQRWGAVWLLTTAATIWSTHFIAMDAYRVPYPSGFLIGRTILSFAAAVVLVGVAGWIGMSGRSRRSSTIAGAVIGLAIVAMHYLGMSAFRTTGAVVWDWSAVAASIVAGPCFGALAGSTGWRERSPRVWIPSLLLALAICSAHFIAMSAATIVDDPRAVLPPDLLGRTTLSWAVAGIAGFVVCLTIASFRLYQFTVRRAFAERRRFQEFADLAVEGLVICDGDRIVWANHSIETMTGHPRSRYVGEPMHALFTSSIAQQFSPDREVETVVGHGVDLTPVRVITKSIVIENRPHLVIAVRDQRERLRTEAEMRRLADSDPLTGLANRARFNEMIGQMLASRRTDERSFALLVARSRSLQVRQRRAWPRGRRRRAGARRGAAQRDRPRRRRWSRASAATSSRSSRANVADIAGIRTLADRIVEVLSRPFVIDGQVHEIGASVGVAVAPSDGDDGRPC